MQARSMTKLQKLIAHSSAVEAIISHLQDVFNQYGPGGFDTITLENVRMKFLEANAKKILEQFHDGINSEEAMEAFVEIAEVFNSDPRFNQILQHYHDAHADGSEKLRNYLLAEISCCILETCMTTTNQPLFNKWRALQLHHKNSKSEEEQKRLKKIIEDGALLLANVRKAVADYKHPELQPLKKKISLTTKKINPMALHAADQMLLASLIHSHPNVNFFDAVDADTGKPVKYLVPDPVKTGVFHHVKLTHSIVRYHRKKSAEHRFAVCHSSPLGQGYYGVVYESAASLSIKPGAKGKPDRAVVKKKSPEKARVVKYLHDANIASREGELLQKVMLLHAKQPTISDDPERASLIMRKFKGKELIDHLIADWGDDHNVVTRNTFTVDQRIALTIMVGEAIIKQVHQSGIIHRDIKGDNIMVELDAQNNPLSAVVIDYGLAKYKGEKTDEHVGTSKPVDYRAPEVIAKYNPSSDEKSDAYSFATLLKEVIWYDVIHGKRYNDLTSKQKIQISEIIQRGVRSNVHDRASLQAIVDAFKEILLHRTVKPAVSDRDY